MKIRTFTVNKPTEVIIKILKEVFTLYKVKLVGREGIADYQQLSVVNIIDENSLTVATKVALYDALGREEIYKFFSKGYSEESVSAEVHRMIKLNLYQFFRTRFQMPQAPWGILHGVRPTKIVHRLLKRNFMREDIIKRLKAAYDCSLDKAILITDIAIRQKTYLANTTPNTVSIYVGIPFCLTRCLYCSFPANLLPSDDKIEEFMCVLRSDLEAVKKDITNYGLRVQSIYVGGGTPTSLPNAYFTEMLELVYNAFYDEDVLEFTVEAGRPDTITDEKIHTMKRLSVTRVSVNPQSMKADTLKRIGRGHTPEDIIYIIDKLRVNGDFEINMDLILGLPGESVSDVEHSIKEVAKLKPDDITVHALAIKKGSKLKLILENNNSEKLKLPSDEEALKMYDIVSSNLAALDMKPYYLYRQGYMSGDLENAGYARQGAESIYNIQIIEENQTIIGIGSGATTKVVNYRTGRMKATFNAKDLTTYLADINVYIAKRRKLLLEVYGDNDRGE